jgi:phage repressor protein C with HTH and peptisase S24 domain
MLVRRVVGGSMQPSLFPNQLVLGRRGAKPKIGSLVIVKYRGKEIVKRLDKIDGQKLFITGDNEQHSLDSRKFGWISQELLVATVIWPRRV